MKKCKLTGEKLNNNNEIRISKNYYITKNWYDKITWYLSKGLPTIEEVENTYELFNHYYKTIRQHITKIKKIAIIIGEEYKELLKKIMIKENTLSINKYKKTRQCLNIEEHLEILTIVIQELEQKLSITKTILSNTKIAATDWKRTLGLTKIYLSEFIHEPKNNYHKIYKG